ncbi:hypothetical protein V1264_017264 [Littorina saxatilis]|uniref:Uncharacterized protein n=1 Tax=Littorina saxatilis TaxID=31220 RepID=A0AAN9BI71_9CAEN
MPKSLQFKVRARETRKVALCCFQYVIRNLYNVRTKTRCGDGQGRFISNQQLPFPTEIEENNLTPEMLSDLLRIHVIFDHNDKRGQKLCTQASIMLTRDTCVKETMQNLRFIFEDHRILTSEWAAQQADYIGTVPGVKLKVSAISVNVDPESNCLLVQWPSSLGENVITAALKLQSNLREDNRQPTEDEYFFTHLAYHELSETHCDKSVLMKESRSLGTPGFRTHSNTYIAHTDPGEGHVLGTTRRTDWLKGSTVHVEYVERPRNWTRIDCESYRFPSSVEFSRVRLHVGADAPSTFYVGRPLKDCGDFKKDLLKVVHTTSTAASYVFSLGAAECKFSMEGLSTSQALCYMKEIRSQVRRSKWQVLSAAWNLNQTWIDDINDEGQSTEDNVERHGKDIVEKAVITTCLGGFDKVTLDGASETYPSTCILPHQLEEYEALAIVHFAHERGLLTYFSAGFKYINIPYAVRSGVDGIGIGGAGILHYMDTESGFHGPYMEENISAILKTRDDAAATLKGKAACLLARLDTMYDEGSISCAEDEMRKDLFSALLPNNTDDMQIIKMSEKLCHVSGLPLEGVLPYLHRAKRLVEADMPVLRNYCINEKEWKQLTHELGQLIRDEDEKSLMREYDNGLWQLLRMRYHKKRLGNILGSSIRQSLYTVKK